MKRLLNNLVPATVTAALLFVAEGGAEACFTAKVCVKIPVSTDDLPVGDRPAEIEMYIGEEIAQIPARWARATLVPLPPEPSRAVLLDEDGCFEFETAYSDGFTLMVYPEAYAGVDNAIHVLAFDNFIDFNEAGTAEAEPLKPWVMHLGGIGPGDNDVMLIPADYFVSAFFVLALDTIYVIGSELGNLPGTEELRLYTDTVFSAKDDGDDRAALGGYAGVTGIYLSEDLVDKKFVIAHEVGHWFASNWDPFYASLNDIPGAQFCTENPGAPLYCYNPLDAPCRFKATNANSLHGIRSAEFGRGAFVEGFAQFIAARTFDDATTSDALYKYYKDIDINDVDGASYESFVEDDQYVVSLTGGDAQADPLGGQSAWVENMCEADFGQSFEISSELDWMRMLWQFLEVDVPGEPKPSLLDIFELLEVAETADHAGWSEAVCDPENPTLDDFCDRFDILAAANGIDNGA